MSKAPHTDWTCGVHLIEAAVCAFQRDWARVVYWVSAAALTVSTVAMK